jgi:hypothetical protein
MKRVFPFLVAVLTVATSVSAAFVESQTSWFLGPGQTDPVSGWGEKFYASDSVAYTISGQLSLLAESVDHSSWAKHIIEANVGIESHGNPLPADMDNDGDLDIVAIIGGADNAVVMYERDLGSYTKRVIGYFYNGPRATTWPHDMDQDGDNDVVASGNEGLAWFENDGLSFTKHVIDNTDRLLYARPADVDGDGDVDVIAHDLDHGTLFGDLWLYRNDGLMGFAKELIYNATTMEIWRVNLADFDGDGSVDIQTSMDPVYVFLNDGSGNFTREYVYNPYPKRIDGSWPNDFDADGDVDIMCATWGGSPYPTPLFWLENDGTGKSFSYHYIGGDNGDYGDGGMATDVNLDGLMDALGTYRYVGWFEQQSGGGFTEHRLPDSYIYDSHWVYGENLDGGLCTGDADIDILAATHDSYVWWENQIVTYAAAGWLESSILDGGVTTSWMTFGWDDCEPQGYELRYRVRSGKTVPELFAEPWSSPIIVSGDTLSKYGIGPGQYFQYMIEFERTTGSVHRTPIVYEVWVEYEEYSPPSLVTGGGWIPGPPVGKSTKRTFGFNAHTERGVTWGQLQFIDHNTKMKVHSDTIDILTVYGDTVGVFSGECSVDHMAGYTFRCRVEDWGEPGRMRDVFRLNIYDGGGNVYYSAGDILGGGNIQVHVFPVGGLVERDFGQALPGESENIPRLSEQAAGVPGSAGDENVTEGDPNPAHQMLAEGHLPGMYPGLLQNSPNPFNSRTAIRYSLPSARMVDLRVYSTAGELVATLVNGYQAAGEYEYEWKGRSDSGIDLKAGIYIYRIDAGDFSESRKMVLVR